MFAAAGIFSGSDKLLDGFDMWTAGHDKITRCAWVPNDCRFRFPGDDKANSGPSRQAPGRRKRARE